MRGRAHLLRVFRNDTSVVAGAAGRAKNVAAAAGSGGAAGTGAAAGAQVGAFAGDSAAAGGRAGMQDSAAADSGARPLPTFTTRILSTDHYAEGAAIDGVNGNEALF